MNCKISAKVNKEERIASHGGEVGEHTNLWRTLGYSALLGGLIVSLTNVGISFSTGEEIKKMVALYGAYGAGMSLPFVILMGKMRNFFSMEGWQKNLGTKRPLDFGEFLLVNERPHLMYFAGMFASAALLLLFSALLYCCRNMIDIWVLGLSLILVLLIYILSKSALSGSPNRTGLRASGPSSSHSGGVHLSWSR